MILDFNDNKTYVKNRFIPKTYNNKRYFFLNYENLRGKEAIKTLNEFSAFFKNITEVKNYHGRFISSYTNAETTLKSLNALKKLTISAYKAFNKYDNTKMAVIGLSNLQKRFVNGVTLLFPSAKIRSFSSEKEALEWLTDDLSI